MCLTTVATFACGHTIPTYRDTYPAHNEAVQHRWTRTDNGCWAHRDQVRFTHQMYDDEWMYCVFCRTDTRNPSGQSEGEAGRIAQNANSRPESTLKRPTPEPPRPWPSFPRELSFSVWPCPAPPPGGWPEPSFPSLQDFLNQTPVATGFAGAGNVAAPRSPTRGKVPLKGILKRPSHARAELQRNPLPAGSSMYGTGLWNNTPLTQRPVRRVNFAALPPKLRGPDDIQDPRILNAFVNILRF